MIPLLAQLAAPAQAQVLVSQTFRISHRVDLDDASPAHGDDWFVDPRGTPKARWASVAYCQGACTSWSSPSWTDDDGLVTFTLDPNQDYKIVLMAVHDYNLSGRKVTVHSADPAWANTFHAVSGAITPLGPTITIDVEFDAAVPGQEWINAAAVASWVVRRRPAAFPKYADNGAEYNIKLYDNSGVTVYSPDSMTVLLDDGLDADGRSPRHSKMIISHEFGHMLAHWANYPGAPAIPWDWRIQSRLEAQDFTTACPEFATGHTINSKEYASGAINEGFANYVTAMAFNRLDEDDCMWPEPGIPIYWDPGDPLSSPSYNPFSCEGYPEHDGGAEWYTAGVPGGNYLGLYCSAGGTWNRATELDWMRFLWDATSKTTMTFVDVVDTLVYAEPHTWNPTDNDILGMPGAVVDFPRYRMKYAFIDLGFGDVWDDYALSTANGVSY